MTGDARADASERESERADVSESEREEADVPAQADADDRDEGGDASDRDEQTGESEDERGTDERERNDSERDESEQELTETRVPMSETNTDIERPDESSTDLAIRRNLFRGALALFALLAVVAVIQLYGSVNATINTFVTSEYQSLFRAAFNLVVLLASGIGISWCVRALTGE